MKAVPEPRQEGQMRMDNGATRGLGRRRIRPRFGLPFWLGVLTFLIGLVAMAPAALLDADLRQFSGGRLYLAQARGTVWNGEAMLAVAGGGPSRAIAWEVMPSELMQGRIALGLSLGDSEQAVLSRGFDGRLTLEGLNASLPGGLLGAALPALHRLALGGTVEIAAQQLAFGNGALEGSATLRWLRAGTAFAKVNPLGDYLITLNGSGPTSTLEVRTLRGALKVDANGRLATNGRMSIQGTAQPSDTAPELKQFLAFMGPMQGDVLPFNLQF